MNILEDYFDGAERLAVQISDELKGDFFLKRRQLCFRMRYDEDRSGTLFSGRVTLDGQKLVYFKLNRLIRYGMTVATAAEPSQVAVEYAAESSRTATDHAVEPSQTTADYTVEPSRATAEYAVEWVALGEDNPEAPEWEQMPRFEAVELECPELVYRLCLREQLENLQDIRCGRQTMLSVKGCPLRSADDGAYGPDEIGRCINLNTAALHFERQGKLRFTLRGLKRLLTYSNAILSVPSWRPLECAAIRVRLGGEWWDFSFGQLPFYSHNNMGAIDRERIDKVNWRTAFSRLLDKDLAPALYWRTLNIIHQQDELFLENGLNTAYICIDSLFTQTAWFRSKSAERSADYEEFLRALAADSELHQSRGLRKVRNFLERPATKAAYLNRGAFDDKLMRVFKHLDAKATENREFFALSAKIRNDLAHGRLASCQLDKLSDQKFSQYFNWLMQNLQIAMIEFISGNA